MKPARAISRIAPVVVCALASTAQAHDPVPAGVTPLFSADGALAGGYVNYGFVLLEDAVPTWVCEEVLPRAATDVWLAPDGMLVVTTRGGVQLSHDGGCLFEAAAGIDELLPVAGLTSDPSTRRLWATTTSTSDANGLYRSDDDGTSWQQIAAPEPDALLRDPLFDAVRAGVWVNGYLPESNEERLFFVDDATGEATDLSARVDGVIRAQALDVDPVTGDVLVGAAIDYGTAVLLRCNDDACDEIGRFEGGDFNGPHAVTTAIIDGDDVWATFTEDVLYRSTGGGDFAEVAGPTRCVTRSPAGAMVGCARIFEDTNFMVRDGDAWVPTFDYRSVTPRVCPQDSLANQACPILWNQIGVYGIGPEPDVNTGGDAGGDADAGADDVGDESSPARADDGCSAAPRGGGIPASLLLAGLLANRRRRTS